MKEPDFRKTRNVQEKEEKKKGGGGRGEGENTLLAMEGRKRKMRKKAEKRVNKREMRKQQEATDV